MTVVSRILDPYASESATERAKRLNDELRDRPAEDILEAAIKREFPGRIAVVSSFGAESAVLLALMADIDPATPVLFLETGKHFAETGAHRNALIDRLGLEDVRLLRPSAKELAEEDPDGDLWSRDPDACCNLRKTRPLDLSLQGFDAWVTGRKRFQSETRLSLPVVETDDNGNLKFNPLANWSQDDLDAFMEARDLPRHPLVAQGYVSIGCEPCTSPVAEGEDARAGRWRGQDKDECGIHITADGRIVRTSAEEAS
ncbi:MAG: phosphoadenylyl-sulfate reductase [Maricaulaceae bacterium]|jgi:phosphoadenosine phosphosulfate reductase